MQKIAVIGANGQLGSDIVRIFSEDTKVILSPLTHNDIEITQLKSIQSSLGKVKPTIVINTAAYNKVDEAEKNPNQAFLVNAIACKYLAQYCQANDSILVQISTDYVFGADKKRNKPYTESDCPGPVNTYGIAKLAGEYFVQAFVQKYFVIRTSGLFGTMGSSRKEGNFVERILQAAKEKGVVGVVDDQILTPTYTLELARQLYELMKTDSFGLYHATAEGQCSWYEFAKEIFALTKTKINLEPITSSELNAKAKRPSYSVLENQNLKKLGIHAMKNWKEGLYDYLQDNGYIQ